MNFSEIQLPSNRKFGFFFAAIFIILGFYFIKGVVNFSYISFVIITFFSHAHQIRFASSA